MKTIYYQNQKDKSKFLMVTPLKRILRVYFIDNKFVLPKKQNEKKNKELYKQILAELDVVGLKIEKEALQYIEFPTKTINQMQTNQPKQTKLFEKEYEQLTMF